MDKLKKRNIVKILTITATILAIVVSGITIYKEFFGKDDLVIEQRLSPEMMDKLENGDSGEITIEKGITIRRDNG
jgi:hypothetical protein